MVRHDSPANDITLPVPRREIDGVRDVRVPTPTDHEELRVLFPHFPGCSTEIRHQNNVAIAVANNVMASNLLRTVKNVIESLSTMLVSLAVRFMAEPVFGANSCGTLIVSK